MRNHTTLPFLSSIFKPTQVFIALLIAVIIWLYPAITQPVLSNTEKIRKPLQEYGGVSLVSAIEAHAPNCDRSCQNEVCVSWIPGPSPRCPRPGPGGGCCTNYETQCDPGCSDPTPILPPTIAATLSCLQNGSNGWCIGSLSLNLVASDPQGQPIIISGALMSHPLPVRRGPPHVQFQFQVKAQAQLTIAWIQRQAFQPAVRQTINWTYPLHSWMET